MLKKNASRKKGKKLRLKHISFQLVLVIIVIVLFIGIFIGYAYVHAVLQAKNTPSSDGFYRVGNTNGIYLPATGFPSPVPNPIITTLDPNNYKVDTSNWQTYHDSTFDISIKYPPDWKVYPSDEKQFGPDAEGNGFNCMQAVDLLRDPNSCNPNTLNHGFGIEPLVNGIAHVQSGLALYVHQNGGGGDSVNTTLPIKINGNSYVLNLTYYKPNSIGNSYNEGVYRGAVFDPLPIPGLTSIWKSVHLEFSASDSDLPTVINILESIKS